MRATCWWRDSNGGAVIVRTSPLRGKTASFWRVWEKAPICSWALVHLVALESFDVPTSISPIGCGILIMDIAQGEVGQVGDVIPIDDKTVVEYRGKEYVATSCGWALVSKLEEGKCRA